VRDHRPAEGGGQFERSRDARAAEVGLEDLRAAEDRLFLDARTLAAMMTPRG
jgi:hypothetical protein